MKGIAAIGEVMIELAPLHPPTLRLGYAGDTYNTAIYLARHGVPVSYCTHLGQDRHSDAILAQLAHEQVNTQLISRHPIRLPGLYMINNLPDGEREFSYWRDQSAARLLFSEVQPPVGLFEHAMIYLSGITLAIISPEARAHLFEQLADYRARGGRVAFDSNYRPRLWPDQATAQNTTRQCLQLTDIALLTLDDEQLLWGEADEAISLARLRALGLTELVVKRGAKPALVSEQGGDWQPCPVVKVSNVIDTTAAGDSFNAGYLSARLMSANCATAVRTGALCAGAVIQHKGAIVDRDAYNTSHQDLSQQS
ncbi:sugar kinase [Simiduia agarivorans]|uniref:2-keto-3-deoxygluconate kinase n=1 Tax=Simiduia agarivorans (strain DSM 21679 / JCM 13881 / BCRC 17597 / SA1) TaxID=1117647 RepID=K4KZA1_SIMAS|nr:sugar kinase [Simiduia agarivorans]AFU99242.1 2-keto-3-deoxygluconate kinase [Simiduia agarivorans SA1 = DSM 21679]